VIGEKCFDVFVYGNVDRLSPEAPIPVFLPQQTLLTDGMAANVFRNVKSIVGDCSSNIKGFYQNETVKKTRYVERKSNYPFIRVDEEGKIQRIKLTDVMIQNIKNADAVIVSDYDKGFLLEEDLCVIADNAKISILDTKKKLKKETIKCFNFVKLNKKEFENNFTEEDELLDRIIITLGAKGAQYKGKIYPSDSPQETIDVSGAGDTFVAAFTVSYVKTNDVEFSIDEANKISSMVVKKRGVSVPYEGE
jgi:D-beta-D-heptose 7-phosphate kinase/D-beta-D-heptose 1-phosphate adenosyltransferase